VTVSKNWGFTKFTKEQIDIAREEGKLVNDGINVKILTERGPLSRLGIGC